MKVNYFEKRAIKYFSFYILIVLLSNSIFFAYKSDTIFDKYNKSIEEKIEKILMNFGKRIDEKLRNSINEIELKNQSILSEIENNEYLLKSLFEQSEGMKKIFELSMHKRKILFDNEEVESNDYYLESKKIFEYNGEKKEVNIVAFLDEEELLKDRFTDAKGIEIVNSSDKRYDYVENLFEIEGKKTFFYTKSSYDYFRIYISIGSEGEKNFFVIVDLKMDEYRQLIARIKKENVELLTSIKKETIVAAFIFYLIAFVILYYVINLLYSPMKEVMDAIDQMSKGKFGKKIRLTGSRSSRNLARKINSLSENLNFIKRVKSDFLLKKNFEFKSIVDSIVSLTESSLENKSVDPIERKNLELINENAQDLLKVVSSLNEYYSIDDKEGLVLENINIKTLVDETFILLDTYKNTKRIKLVNKLSYNDSFVYGDNAKLHVIFSHLIENSIDSMDMGEIVVEGKKKNGYLNIVISDNGRGIDKEKLREINTFFVKGEELSGTGLGISLSKKIIELHGGKISFTSKLGRGTDVIFTLESCEEEKNKERSKIDLLKEQLFISSQEVFSKRRYNILLYCNSALNSKLIVNYLIRVKYKVTLVSDNKELFKLLKEENYDLLIIDYFGIWAQEYEIINEIRKLKNKDLLPILLVNNKNRGEDIQLAFHKGVNEVINKPLFRDEFLIKVDTQLKIKKTLSSIERVNKNYIREKKERILAENLRDFQTELTSTLNVKKIFLILFKKIKYLFDFDSAIVLLKKGDRYQVIFQEGSLEKEEKTDTLFKSRYLDPIVKKDRIIVINENKCKKYFSDRIKSAIVVPLRYNKNENCVIIIKSTENKFFKTMAKETIDTLFYQSSIAIKNANLYGELEKKNIKLNMLLEKIKIIDKLIAVIYNEKDKNSAIYYLLLVLVGNKMKLNFREAYYFDYNREEKKLVCLNYHHNINKYSDSTEDDYKAREIWAKNLKLEIDEENILTRAYKEGRSIYNYILELEERKTLKYMEQVTIVPIKYENNKFGLIVLESEVIGKEVDEDVKESLNIFGANLGIYLQTKALEEESIKYHKSRTLNTFAKSIVHELRTPLVGIKGFATMTKEKYSSDDKLSFYMNNIISDAERVIDLSSQIVDFVEEENAKYAFKKESIRRGIIEVVDEFKEEIKLNGINIKIFDDEELFLPYDKVKMKKVFRHILKNSVENIDFNKDIHIINIEKKIDRDKIVISFVDNGLGIEKEMLKEVFNPLVSSKLQGTGLGLSLSKNIVEKHGFDMEIESEQGHFTKVNIIIT